MNLKLMRIWLLILGALGLALAIGSCGKVADPVPVFDSNTNWLMRCGTDDQCDGSLRCYCGICTKPCGLNDECSRLEGAQCSDSGEVLCGERPSAGGLCVLGCSKSAECGTGFDCTQGQCVPKPCNGGSVSDWDQTLRTIRTDLASQSPSTREYSRYFVIGNDASDVNATNGSCGLRLEVQRQALTKLINSLSRSAILTAPRALDLDQRLYRIDVRDYGWEQSFAGLNYQDAWDAVAARDPYALWFVGDDADDISENTKTRTPVMLVDSFIATATLPDIYYLLLGVRESAGTDALTDLLLNQLNIQDGAPTTFEAGFSEGGVEFLAEQWSIASRSGYVWMISDFRRGPGALFSQPLDAPLGDHELIYTLPNGLEAYAFMSADRNRLDGWNASADGGERDGLTRAPRSNLRRHTPRLGIRDEVRAQVELNPERFAASELALIEQRFEGQVTLEKWIEQDFNTFPGRSLQALGINPNAPDPVLQAYASFDRDVTLEVAAAELMIEPDDLRENLSLLDPALAALDGGSVPRSVFTALYVATTCLLSTPLENQPDPNLCP